MNARVIFRLIPILTAVSAVLVLLAVLLWPRQGPLAGLTVNPHGAHTLIEINEPIPMREPTLAESALMLICRGWTTAMNINKKPGDPGYMDTDFQCGFYY